MINGLQEHVALLLSGATGFGVVAHAVNTFPTPSNKYGAWLFGTIQYIVGQRVVAKNTLQGFDTQATGVGKEGK